MPSPSPIRPDDSGSPLDPGVRRVLEDSFGTDLSGIRVRSGAAAAALLRGHRVSAAAAGHHVFLPGRRPGDGERWLRLAAHEVAHSIQQAQGISVHGPAQERQADRAADAAVAGRPFFRAGLEPPRAGHGARVLAGYDSWEHRLLGDVPGPDLAELAARSAKGIGIAAQQAALMKLWIADPTTVNAGTIHGIDPGVQLVLLSDGLLMATWGEINALADYVPNLRSYGNDRTGDEVPADKVYMFLQCIRQESYNKLAKIAIPSAPGLTFPKAWPIYTEFATLRETRWLDQQTTGLGADHYMGLLARNACHFAPFSWYRWLAAHTTARASALAAYNTAAGDDKAALTNAAWLAQGYADHFLQDSYAPGHLTNKTRIMQVFIDWVGSTWTLPVLNWDLVSQVTLVNQPGLMGAGLYRPPFTGPSNDPQTAEEHSSLDDRISATKIQAYGTVSRAQAYQQYLAFLQASIVQLSTNLVHDHFNHSGLAVASVAHPQAFTCYGDHELLNQANQGLPIAAAAVAASQSAITQILHSGAATQAPADVLNMAPSMVTGHDGTLLPLLDWHKPAELDAIAKTVFDGKGTYAEYQVTRAAPSMGIVTSQGNAPLGVLWDSYVTSLPDGAPVTPFWDGARLYMGWRQEAYQLDITNGTLSAPSSTYNLGAVTDVLFASDGTRLFMGKEGLVVALDPDRLTEIWTSDWLCNAPRNKNVNLVMAGDGHLYAGTQDGFVYELDPATGHAIGGNQFWGKGGNEARLAVTKEVLVVGISQQIIGLGRTNLNSAIWPTDQIVYNSANAVVDVLAIGTGIFGGNGEHAVLLDADLGSQLCQFSDYLVGAIRQDTDGIRLYRAGVDSTGLPRISALDVAAMYAGANDPRAWYSQPLLQAGGAPVAATTPVNVLVAADRLFAGVNGVVCELNPASGLVTGQWQPVADSQTEVRMASDGFALYCGTASPTAPHVVAYDLLA